MLFDLCSDLHTDFYREPLDFAKEKNPGSDVLIINGDTTNNTDNIWRVLNSASEAYALVLLTDGNHEHYAGRPIVATEEALKLAASKYSNVQYLNNEAFVYNGTTFIGGNSWYDFNVNTKTWPKEQIIAGWKAYSNDPNCIWFKDTSPEVKALAASAAFERHLADASGDVVCFTHTAPHSTLVGKSIHDKYRIIDGAYCNTLMMQFSGNPKVKVWCYGHTHTRNDEVIDGIRYVNNSRGYPTEIRSPWFMVQIDTDSSSRFSNL